MKKGIWIYTLLLAAVAMTIASCNDDDDDSTIVYGTSTTSSLVSSFVLQEDDDVLENLDSVQFCIDQEKLMIYNPDSLPYGTDVTHLLCTISFGTTVSSATIVVGSGTVQVNDTTITYSTSSTDSIDFTGRVTLNVTSANATNIVSYRVYVNVHQENSDSIYFPITARRDLPAAADDNYAVGMASLNDTFYSVVNNSNGRYMCTASTPAGRWTTRTVAYGFTPDEESLTATSDALYILDDEGNLYTSTDALSWTATGQVWESIIGSYNDRVLGLLIDGGSRYTDEYPRRSGFAPTAMPDDFPVSGHSQLIVEESTWSLGETALMVGGRDASGNLVSTTWGYDGNTWGKLSHDTDSELPAIEGPSIFSYFTYNVSAYSQHATSVITWVLMGGCLEDGTFNRVTYLSRDMGITWLASDDCMTIPSYIPSFMGAKAFVCTEVESIKAPARRVSAAITEWDVPYVYIVGGTGTSGDLLNNVWKGYIARMLYRPVY